MLAHDCTMTIDGETVIKFPLVLQVPLEGTIKFRKTRISTGIAPNRIATQTSPMPKKQPWVPKKKKSYGPICP